MSQKKKLYQASPGVRVNGGDILIGKTSPMLATGADGTAHRLSKKVGVCLWKWACWWVWWRRGVVVPPSKRPTHHAGNYTHTPHTKKIQHDNRTRARAYNIYIHITPPPK